MRNLLNNKDTYMHAYKKSFLNYPGGKYKLLPQLLPLFPSSCSRMIDLFSGSAVISTNYKGTDTYLINDKNMALIKLLSYIVKSDINSLLTSINQVIRTYHLSDTKQNGYYFYKVSSSKGLASVNRENYNRLRTDFNQENYSTYPKEVLLYVLTVYAFNNQLRFNKKGCFNTPVGKRDFNEQMIAKLKDFKDFFTYQKKVSFSSLDFEQIHILPSDFIYADPPYLITNAVYNEGKGWNKADEKRLLDYLDRSNESGAKFALSNVLVAKGTRNLQLADWLDKNKKRYHIYHLKKNYCNSNYQIKNRSQPTDEVLITNYLKSNSATF